jgi:hypothetical protein
MRQNMSRGFSIMTLTILLPTLLLLITSASPSFAQESDKNSVGLIAGSQATTKDVGLPIYPHSKPHVDNSNDSQAANLGLWGGGSGFKLAVMKMESADPPDKLAKFYKKALAKYGKVLDCSNPQPSASGDKDKNDSSNVLTCADDKPDPGGLLFKSGTKEMQHLVAIQPNAKGSLYQLVAVGSWSSNSHH